MLRMNVRHHTVLLKQYQNTGQKKCVLFYDLLKIENQIEYPSMDLIIANSIITSLYNIILYHCSSIRLFYSYKYCVM